MFLTTMLNSDDSEDASVCGDAAEDLVGIEEQGNGDGEGEGGDTRRGIGKKGGGEVSPGAFFRGLLGEGEKRMVQGPHLGADAEEIEGKQESGRRAKRGEGIPEFRFEKSAPDKV